MYRVNKILLSTKVIQQKIRNTSSILQTSIQTINEMPHPRSLPVIGTAISLWAAGSGSKNINNITCSWVGKIIIIICEATNISLAAYAIIIPYKLHEYIDARHKSLGPIFYEKLGGNTKLVFISDPDIMKTLFINLEGKYPTHILPDPWILYEKLYGSKRGLFFMNGEEWLTSRRIMNKHLMREDSEKWLKDPIESTIANFITDWIAKSKGGNFVPNLESDFYRLATDVVINVLLGSDRGLVKSKHYEQLLTTFSETVKNIFITTTKLHGLPINWCQRFNLKVWRDFQEAVDLSITLAQKIVREMLTKRYDHNGLIKKLCDEDMSDVDITRIVADFVIAAGDTTAYTSLWTLYLLSTKESVQKELQNKNKNYMKYVIKESMRLFPVAPFLTRILTRDGIIGQFNLKEGTPVIASIYTSGRHEKNFSNANEFLPHRWDRSDPRRKDLANHVPSASLPFALGARSCVGQKIAMLQLIEVIHQIITNFDIKCINNTEVKAMTSQVLVPNQGIQLRVSLRNK